MLTTCDVIDVATGLRCVSCYEEMGLVTSAHYVVGVRLTGVEGGGKLKGMTNVCALRFFEKGNEEGGMLA